MTCDASGITTRHFARSVSRAVSRLPNVRSVRLVGSRAGGRATILSDWDFLVETSNLPATAAAISEGLSGLSPLASFWDPLSRHWNRVLILPGPRKVDLLFGGVHPAEPPWIPTRAALPAINMHFWDWIWWIASKKMAGKEQLVASELLRMHWYLLRPLGVESSPRSVGAAVESYRLALRRAEKSWGAAVDAALESEILRGFRKYRIGPDGQ